MIDISYITSCYNSEEFLDGLIENLLQQSHEDWELIVVDSASIDNSIQIVKKWQASDDRIKLIVQPSRTNYGISWLVGWQQAKGKIVTNSNSDDRSYPWRGTQVLEYQKRGDKNHFYYGGYETRVGGITTVKGLPPPYSREDMSQFFRCGVHIHWDNSLREMVDWDRMFKAGKEYKSAFDYWLVLYFMSLGVTGIPIPSCFSIYNQRSNSLEQSNKELNCFEGMRAISEFHPNGKVMYDLETKTQCDSPEFYNRFKEFLHEHGE